MKAPRSTKEKIGRAISWIGVGGFLFGFVGSFVMDDLYLREPRAPQRDTGNIIYWDYKNDVHYITKFENDLWWYDWNILLPLMFATIIVGVSLTPDENEKWLKKFKPKF